MHIYERTIVNHTHTHSFFTQYFIRLICFLDRWHFFFFIRSCNLSCQCRCAYRRRGSSLLHAYNIICVICTATTRRRKRTWCVRIANSCSRVTIRLQITRCSISYTDYIHNIIIKYIYKVFRTTRTKFREIYTLLKNKNRVSRFVPEYSLYVTPFSFHRSFSGVVSRGAIRRTEHAVRVWKKKK